MLATQYTHTVSHVSTGVEIVLTETATGREKRFFLAGPNRPLEPLRAHLDSLTDDLCSQWFNAKKQTKGKKS